MKVKALKGGGYTQGRNNLYKNFIQLVKNSNFLMVGSIGFARGKTYHYDAKSTQAKNHLAIFVNQLNIFMQKLCGTKTGNISIK